MGLKKMDTMQAGHEGGVCVTVRQRAPVLPTHLHRAVVDAGSGDIEQKVIDMWHIAGLT